MVTNTFGAVHPHVRGEHDELLIGHVGDRRFIPTCVGNTAPAAVAMMRSAVHPHVRGEHGRHLRCSRNKCGSSPRAWGTPGFQPHAHQRRRFIPTCVGNTSMSCASCCVTTVHPHVRGEHLFAPAAPDEPNGSSPRAWGTRPSDFASVQGLRFIPTCVGNTAIRASPVIFWAVHPHVRGEHLDQSRAHYAADGSSPRAWGTLCRRPCGCDPARFIPTCVGNTHPVRA